MKSILLENNLQINASVLEIIRVPHIDIYEGDINNGIRENQNAILRILQDACSFFQTGTIAIELFFFSEAVIGQKYPARVRMFIIIRHLTEYQCELNQISLFEKTIRTALTNISYDIMPIDSSDFELAIGQIKYGYINALVKREKVEIGLQLGVPYYYVDTLTGDGLGNYEGIFEALCQEPGTAFSIQMLSTSQEQDEISSIEMMYQMLSQVVNGISMPGMGFIHDKVAEKALYTYEHLSTLSKKESLFTYNFIAFGSMSGCQRVTSRIKSYLEQEISSQKYNFDVFDISKELICLRTDWIYYPWNVNQLLIYNYRNIQLWNQLRNYSSLFRVPFLVDVSEGTSFFRLPIDNNKIPGIESNHKIIKGQQLRQSVTSKDNIVFGQMENSEVVIGAPLSDFAKHMLVVGMPGSGKTTFAFSMLLQFYKKGIPFIAVEPTKKEYRALIDAIPDLQIFTPGNNQISPFIINPFIPPKGIAIEQYVPSLFNAFQAVIPMPSPLDAVFQQVINDCYALYGWRSYSKCGDPGTNTFGFLEFITQFKKKIRKSEYGREVRGNLESGGVNRLLTLIEQNPYIYDTVNTIPIEDLLSKPTVLELNAIGNTSQKALLISVLLTQICVYVKQNMASGSGLNNVLMIDEAHVLFAAKQKEEISESTSGEALQDMMAEVRSFGMGIIVADQTPSAVGTRTVANTDIKVSFRLVETNEKNIIANSMGLNEIMTQRIATFQPGEAFANYHKLNSPVVIISPDIRKKENIRLDVSDDIVRNRSTYWNLQKSRLLKPFHECVLCKGISCEMKIRADAVYFSKLIYEKRSELIIDEPSLLKHIINVPLLIQSALKDYPIETREQLIKCIRINLYRKALLDKSFIIDRKRIAVALKWENEKHDCLEEDEE